MLKMSAGFFTHEHFLFFLKKQKNGKLIVEGKKSVQQLKNHGKAGEGSP